MRRLAAVLLLLFATTASAQRWTAADRFRIANPSDPQFSPDGASIALVVSRANLKDNRWDPELLVVDVASGAQRSLSSERRGLASPRWSPDGERLAFLANATNEKDAKRQLWIMPMRGGDAKRITSAANGVQQFAWSPDGAQLAYVTADEAPPNADKNNRAFEIDDDDYLITTSPTPSHVWLVSAGGGEAKRLTSGSWSLPVAKPPGPSPSPLSWSPDGKTIAITQRPSAHGGTPNAGRVALVDVATGVVRRLTQHEVEETQPVFSPDGSRIAYWHPHEGEMSSQNAIWIAPAAGGAGTEATAKLDRNVYRAVWMPDGKSFLTGAHDGTTTAYWLQPIDGSAARRLDLGELEPYMPYWIDATVSRSGAIAFTAATPSHPRELYVMASADAKPRQLTHFNDFVSSFQLARAVPLAWTFEGMSEDGVLLTPPDFDATKKYPLVVYIHGGPRSASTTAFSPLTQLMAAQGWLVFSPNYRGSDNKGNAYTRAILHDAGAGPGRDVMAGIDAVKARNIVDADRMVVGGWSYGGYMTTWMIGHYDVFKAAVSGAAVNNLLDSYYLGDSALGRGLTWGSPYASEASMKKFVEQSPIFAASRIKTPTLILSDTGDVRVPITESFQLFRALRDNHVPVKFIAYPVSGHSPEDPAHQADVDRRYIDWFSQYLK